MAKTNIKVSFKTNTRLNPKNIFKDILSEESEKLCFLVPFSIINYICPKNFIGIHQATQKIWVFTSSILTTTLFTFLPFFQIGFFRIILSYIKIGLGFVSVWTLEAGSGESYWPSQNKLPSKSSLTAIKLKEDN